MPKKKWILYHLSHKTRLMLLLLMKIMFAVVTFLLVLTIFTLISPSADFFSLSLFNLIVWLVALSIALYMYLFLVMKILKFLKFR